MVQLFAGGPLSARHDAFVVCMSIEANDKNFQDELLLLRQQHVFEIHIWDAVNITHFLRREENLVRAYFGPEWTKTFFGTAAPRSRDLDADALLLGPVQALGLDSDVNYAEALVATSPAEAAEAYKRIADALRDGFPGHADRFEQLGAKAQRTAGDPHGSHDALMRLAVRDLFERAEPHVTFRVKRGLEDLHVVVDAIRQARGEALVLFGRWHENPSVLGQLADCFDRLGPSDKYAPFIAVLVAEAAIADRDYQKVLDRHDSLRKAGDHGTTSIRLRVRAALADAGASGAWPALMKELESVQSPAEAAYLCLRAARQHLWDGQLTYAEDLYQRGMELAATADLDLDVENALWSLTNLYTLQNPSERILETNRLALSIEGTRSYVKLNSRTAPAFVPALG